MLGRLREIDEELATLPEQLVPLEKQVERGRELVQKSEQGNPMRQSLLLLLRQAERGHIENLGWLVGYQSIDPPTVASYVIRFLLTVAGKPLPAPTLGKDEEPTVANPYDAALVEFVRVENAAGMPPGALEAALLRKLFADPWLAADSKLRSHVMEELKREAVENGRWLPEPKAQILDEEGKSLVGEGAAAFGGYFSAAGLVTLGLRTYRIEPPTRTYSALGRTMALLVADDIYPKLVGPFTTSATTAERGRALMVIAYIHLVRSVEMGKYEVQHRKITDVLSSAEVALQSGRKRLERLRTLRSELVMQSAGIIGLVVLIVAIVLYGVFVLVTGEEPPKK